MSINIPNDHREMQLLASAMPVTIPNVRSSFYRQRGKRLFDITMIIAAAPVWLPVVLILAALVALDGHSPVYSQIRVGKGGNPFRLWKIRTMVPDADDCLADHLSADAAARLEWDVTQKLRNDPRITLVGRLLRKTSLDELPQLLNVLRGEMALVGPRPMLVVQKALYPGAAYYYMRPGITGNWQVSDRNASSFRDRARFDSRYEDEMSFGADLSLLFKTFGAVVKATGF